MKKGIVIALAIAVVFLFVGCGDKPNGDNDKIVKESGAEGSGRFNTCPPRCPSVQ